MISSLIGMAMVVMGLGAEPEVAHAEEEPKTILLQVKVNWTPERIDQEIETRAAEYGVSAPVMKKVIECESTGSTTIQSYHRRPDGSREQSYGLAQIFLPAHPEVTKEQAIDPAFAIRFMAEEFSKGNAWKWTCWKRLK